MGSDVDMGLHLDTGDSEDQDEAESGGSPSGPELGCYGCDITSKSPCPTQAKLAKKKPGKPHKPVVFQGVLGCSGVSWVALG